MKTEKLIGIGLLAYAFLELTKPTRPVYYGPPPGGNLQNNYAAWLQYAKSVTQSALTAYGSIDAAIKKLWGPGGPFEKTPVPEYDAGSTFWQDAGYGNIAGIGKFYDSTKIKPSGRVDRYWSDLNINAQEWGVEKRTEAYYRDPAEAVKHFGLHSIEFGNWLNQEDRIGFMYGTLVTLRDIGQVTGVRQNKLGMGKRLALAFGARGNGGRAAAFYIPAPYHLINLTKTHGRGSFCHEYGHAVDFYFKGASGWQSTRKQPDYTGIRIDSVDYYFEKVLDTILWNKNGDPSSYHLWLLKQTEYYNRRNEIWARICERFFMWKFKEKGIFNTWGIDRVVTADLPDLELVKKAAPFISKIFGRLNGRSVNGMGAIYPEIPALYECNDGTFSTSDSPRGCTRHGGKRSGTPVQLSENYSGLLNIRDVPLEQINVDTTLFQGREKAFSERSVNNIVQDVEAGRFLWENLDPIILWQSPEGKLYLLSGHSRLEGFRRLAARNAKAQGKGFFRIPAKILQNVPVDVAQTVALESNTLSTKETDLERAGYYRRLRQEGTPEKTLLDTIKKNESRNWTNIYAYTFLNPNGAAWATLKQFGESEDTNATLAKSLAKWLGQARRQLPVLTNEHENEVYRWLFEQKGYGTGRGQVSNEREFLERVNEFVQKNTFFGQFDQSKPLNIQNLLTKSPAEQEYDIQIDGARREVQEAENKSDNWLPPMPAKQTCSALPRRSKPV